MRLILHTLKKDVLRLWPAALVTWILLAALANADRWRADPMASEMEGWLNLILAFAFACLGALAVFEEPLVGTRNFWMTRPYQWQSLLAAKLCFVALAIHLPWLIADIFILTARGFSPVASLGVLSGRHLLFFGAVVLPAMAIAALLRNFTHFIIAAFVVAAILAISNGGFQSYPELMRQVSAVKGPIVSLALALFAALAIGLQYTRRLLMPARVCALLGALSALSLSAWLPLTAAYALPGSASSSVVLREGAEPEKTYFEPLQRIASLPVTIRPAMDNFHGSSLVLEAEVLLPSGERIASRRPSPYRPNEAIDFVAQTIRPANTAAELNTWIVLSFSNRAWERVRRAPVRLRGAVGLTSTKLGKTAVLPANGTLDVPGLGRCTLMPITDWFQRELVKVLCESTEQIAAARVVLRVGQSGREWNSALGRMSTVARGPRETWFSPLHRADTFFTVTGDTAADKWLVPKNMLSDYRVEITPEIVTGHSLAKFDFSNIDLAAFGK